MVTLKLNFCKNFTASELQYGFLKCIFWPFFYKFWLESLAAILSPVSFLDLHKNIPKSPPGLAFSVINNHSFSSALTFAILPRCIDLSILRHFKMGFGNIFMEANANKNSDGFIAAKDSNLVIESYLNGTIHKLEFGLVMSTSLAFPCLG